jgi:hypothetical protein
MRHISFLFIVLGLISLSPVSSRAQREIGAGSIALDDGAGHVVDIKLPSGLTGSFIWTLPITSGGTSLSLPAPTTVGSMLYSNGSNTWLENTKVTATNTGALTAASNINTTAGSYQIGGSTVLSNAGTQNIFVGVGAGSGGAYNTAVGYNASVGTGATALGANSSASTSYATALGYGSSASGSYAIATGYSASASAAYTTALGYSASAGANFALALGPSAVANFSNSTALGNGATASAANTIQLGNTSVTLVNTSGTITAGGVSPTNLRGAIASAYLQGAVNGSVGVTTYAGNVLLDATSTSVTLTGSATLINANAVVITTVKNTTPANYTCYVSNVASGTITVQLQAAVDANTTISYMIINP